MPPVRAVGSKHSGGEFAAIERWLSVLPGPEGVGPYRPGDDAAWLSCSQPIAMSVDTVAEGVHFRRHWCSAQDLGWRSLQAALSDLAACRARPLGFLVSLSVPAADFAEPAWLDEVVAGLGEAAQATSCPVLGGDTTGSPDGLVLALTVIGTAHQGREPLCRAGAQPGDLLQLSGPTGWAGLAVERLLAEQAGTDAVPAPALAAWRRPQARLDLLDALAGASAAIDVSDGLLADAQHLGAASGCSLVLSRESIASPELLEAVGEEDALRLALSGGEDYEILATAAQPLAGFRCIGEVGTGRGVRWRDGSEVLVAGAPGWDHGRPQ